MANKKKRKTGLFLACWILALLILLIVFMVKKDQLTENMRKTNFVERVFGGESDNNSLEEKKSPIEIVVEKNEEKPKESSSVKKDTVDNKPETKIEVKPEKTVTKIEEKNNSKTDEVKVESNQNKKVEEQKEIVPVVEEKKPAIVETSTAALFFFNEDNLKCEKVLRKIPKNDEPLKTNLTLLIQGPISSEKGYISCIPKSTKIRLISIKNGIATIDLSDDFEFNENGSSGQKMAIVQIYKAATNFSTVKKVQFKIGGKIKDYLGSEGVRIGNPIGEENISNYLIE